MARKERLSTLKSAIPVGIEVRTSQVQEGGKDEYRKHFDGILAEKVQALYLRYEEEDGAKVTFRISGDGVELTRRSGQLRLRLSFSEGESKTTSYMTPYGAVELECRTDRLECEYDEAGRCGGLAVDYVLFTGGEILGEYKIRLQFAA